MQFSPHNDPPALVGTTFRHKETERIGFVFLESTQFLDVLGSITRSPIVSTIIYLIRPTDTTPKKHIHPPQNLNKTKHAVDAMTPHKTPPKSGKNISTEPQPHDETR